MNTFTAKLPMDTIKACVSALNSYRSELAKLMKQKKELEAPEAIRNYSQSHIENELKRIASEAEQIKAEAEKKVTGLHDTATQEIKEAYVPIGSDVIDENDADAALFRNGLIIDTKTLDYMLSKHDNAAFRIMAAKYAKERNWDGYDYTTHEEAANEYVKRIFRELKNVASDPFGYSAIQYTETKGEYRRMAEEYGLIAEYNKAGGDRIDNSILSESLGDPMS